MTEFLGNIKGSNGTYHKISKGSDGVVYCDCWAWKKNKTCKHLDEWYHQTPKKRKQPNNAVREAIEQAVRANAVREAIEQAVRDLS